MTEIERLQEILGDRYAVLSKLGRGGAADVFLCRDTRYSRDVALKVLRVGAGAIAEPERFLREIRITARLQHPHVLPVLDSGPAGDRVYYAMPYVEGSTLGELLSGEGSQAVDRSIQIIKDIGSALSYAHAKGIVHRDVKPSNILLSDGIAILSDFGVARALSASTTDPLTSSGTAVGTFGYMSPEQINGSDLVDERSDVYSLACVAYELLAGEPPFAGNDARIVAVRHLTQTPTSLREIRDVPLRVSDAVDRALAKDRNDRFESVSAFIDALETGIGATPIRSLLKRRIGPWPIGRYAGLAAGGALVALSINAIADTGKPALDAERIAVFPLVELGDVTTPGLGGQVATYMGYLLEGTDPLRWEAGQDWFTDGERSDPQSVTLRRKLEISRERGAGRALDGTILREDDSTTVILRLHDVGTSSMIVQRGAGGPRGSSESLLAARAVSALLSNIIGDRPVDIVAISSGIPTAVAQFHLGEIAFRDMRLADALDHFDRSVQADSSFALAALRGGLAAAWMHQDTRALELTRLSRKHEDRLPPRYGRLAMGLEEFLTGRADEAVSTFRTGIDRWPDWADLWMMLGETYFHLMPAVSPLDSLAKAAFEQAARLDPELRVPLFPLVDFAVWNGDDARAAELLQEIERGNPDFSGLGASRLLLRCVREGPQTIDWDEEVARDPLGVLGGAAIASVMALSLPCTEAATTTLLGTAGVTSNRWGAFVLLQTVLSVQGRLEELRDLVDSPATSGLPAARMYLLDAAAGHDLQPQATAQLTELGTDYGRISSANLWLIGEFAASRGLTDNLGEVVDVLSDRLEGGGSRAERVMLDALSAQLALASGNEESAIHLLSDLTPTGDKQAIMWNPWESLALERMSLAELLADRQEWDRAQEILDGLENHRSVMHLVLLPRVLALRDRIADARGLPRDTDVVRARLAWSQVETGN